MARIFISYSRQDIAAVQRIYAVLDEAFHDEGVFYDRHMQVGEIWWESILRRIAECDVFVYVLSANAVRSEACQAELLEAMRLNKHIISVAIEKDLLFDGVPASIAYTLRRLNWKTAIDGKGGKVLMGIAVKIARLLEGNTRPRNYYRDLSANDLTGENIVLGNGTIINIHNLFQGGQPTPAPLDAPDTGMNTVDVLALQQQMLAMQAEIERLKRGNTPLPESKPDPSQPDPSQPDPVQATRRVAFAPSKPTKPRSDQLLPAPFEWIKIPAGRVTLKGGVYGDGQTFDVAAFEIAKYPVTNAQYAKFIEAGGYKTQKWWTDAGWAQREKDGWTEPRHWQNEKWNGADYPVVGVSWYEAVAFCLWLSETTGDKIMLPTEAQWQYAAQGDDGRAYPWGNDFDKTRCNTRESGIGRTTPVTQYADVGASPFGVVDMAGNVWEWSLTEYESGSNDINSTSRRALRGGSWSLDHSLARAAYRYGSFPDLRIDGFGVRFVRSPS